MQGSMRKQGEVSIWKILDTFDRSFCLVDIIAEWKSKIGNCLSEAEDQWQWILSMDVSNHASTFWMAKCYMIYE